MNRPDTRAGARRAAASREAFAPGEVPTVRITFRCTACGREEGVEVRWSEHHTIPAGWRSRDVAASLQLPRRTDHLFACSRPCVGVLDRRYPPPARPKWFATS